jgi:putative transposase
MYKKIEMLDKKNHFDLSIDDVKDLSFSKDFKIIPLGLSEVSKVASLLPVIISGGKTQEFVAFGGLNNQDSYYSITKCKDIYIPAILRAYPFLMVEAVEEGNENKKYRALAIDIDNKYVSNDKKYKIFEKEGVLSKEIKPKVDLIQKLDIDILNAKRLIAKLKELDVLDKREFRVKTDNKEVVLLKDFYVVNEKRFFNLDDEVLLKFTKDGVVSLIQAHINSISNIEILLKQFIK